MADMMNDVDLRCPACDPPHALVPVDQRGQRLYRCDRTGRQYTPADLDHTLEVLARAPDPARAVEAPLHDSTQLFDADSSSRQKPQPDMEDTRPNRTVGGRSSVLRFLRTRHGVEVHADTDAAAPDLANDASKYAARQEIARGGMGSVTLVHDVDLNRDVAMKTLLPDFARSRESVSRFVEEAQMISQLEHPNITPIYDLGVHDSGEVFFTMKYVRGETLAAIITRLRDGDPEAHATYTWNRRIQIIEQLCEALAFAHWKGVVHRDLKPANIMIGRYGEVQVMDWGIAKKVDIRPDCDPEPGTPCAEAAEVTQVKVNAVAPHDTQVGQVTGTVFYMSPEQATGDTTNIAPTSDVYALGAVMYEFLGLQRAHDGNELSTILRKVIAEDPPPLSEIRNAHQPRVPIELQYIVGFAMKKDPRERYQSTIELRNDLQRYQDGKFPVRCAHTALKRGLVIASRALDSHSHLVMAGLILSVVALALLMVILAIR